MNTTKNSTSRKDGLETKQRLIEAAEVLFAEQGLENVTLADVTRAAQQKNRNAAQYHFGDRNGLINAVLDKHSSQIAIMRKAMLEELNTKSPLRDLVNALVLPVANHVANNPRGPTFLRINRYILSENIELAWARSDNMAEVQALQKLITAKLPKKSLKANQAKMLLVQCMLFNGLASFYEINPEGLDQAFIETLCQSIEAVLLC